MPATPNEQAGSAKTMAIILFSLGSLVLAWPWLSGAVTIPWDAKAHFYPQLQFLAHALHAGESPFWNPNVFAGSPQVADPQSLIFTPPYLLLALLDPNPGFQAMDAVTFAMLWLAGVAVLLFCLDKGWGPAAGLVAAFAFANGGSAAWRIQHTGEVLSFCWFGVTLWLLARALDRRSILYGAASGATAALMIIGRDQIAYLCALVLAIYAVWDLFFNGPFWPRLKSALPALTAAIAVGVVLIAVPIALTIALAAESIRVDIGYEGAARGSLPPASFLTLIVANLFGTDGPMKDYWGPPSSQIWGPNELALARNMADIYVGALPIVAIAAIGMVRGALARREILCLLLATILMVLFALGDFTPFFRAAYQLPGINLFRRPADATFPIGGLLALLGGYCVHAALADRRPMSRTSAAIGAAVVLFLLVVCTGVAFDKGRLQQATPALMLGAILMLGSGLAMVLGRKLAMRHAHALLLIVAGLMTIDLGVSNGPNESTALPSATYDALLPQTTNDTIALLKHKIAEGSAPDRRDRVEMAAVGFEWPNIGMIQGFDHWLGYNPIVLKDFAEATGAIDHVAIPEQRKFSPLFPGYRSVMADLLGVRWIATGVPAGDLDKTFKPGDLVEIARTKDAYVYENPRALPRVLLATDARKAEFTTMKTSGMWPDVDYRRTVLLEDAPTATLARAPGSALLVSYANTRVIIEADAPDGGWVVLNDVWHPWWTAEVDGKPAPIERANVIFRAVATPPGKHRVEFIFRPFSGLMRQMAALF